MVTLLGICSVLFFMINITNAQQQLTGASDISCKTPDNSTGTCIALRQCRPLFRLLRKDIPTNLRTLLVNSQCGGGAGSNINVCCPNTFTTNDLPSVCGLESSDRIVGGDKAGVLEFPWMALLHYRKPTAEEGFLCGGTLIHEKYVLTAAHCIKSPALNRKQLSVDYVRFGETDIRTDRDCQSDICTEHMDIPVAKITVHEYYMPSTNENDIALIRLEQAAPYTDSIRPICLPFDKLKNYLFDEYKMTVAGFGFTENGTKSPEKLKVDVYGFNLNECKNVYRFLGARVNDKQICAGGEENKDSCEGDSGGPLIAKEEEEDEEKKDDQSEDEIYFLIGIVSFGTKRCGSPGFPGIYTRVDKYLEWILDHMLK